MKGPPRRRKSAPGYRKVASALAGMLREIDPDLHGDGVALEGRLLVAAAALQASPVHSVRHGKKNGGNAAHRAKLAAVRALVQTKLEFVCTERTVEALDDLESTIAEELLTCGHCTWADVQHKCGGCGALKQAPGSACPKACGKTFKCGVCGALKAAAASVCPKGCKKRTGEKRTCKKCGELGHMQKTCKNPPRT